MTQSFPNPFHIEKRWRWLGFVLLGVFFMMFFLYGVWKTVKILSNAGPEVTLNQDFGFGPLPIVKLCSENATFLRTGVDLGLGMELGNDAHSIDVKVNPPPIENDVEDSYGIHQKCVQYNLTSLSVPKFTNITEHHPGRDPRPTIGIAANYREGESTYFNEGLNLKVIDPDTFLWRTFGTFRSAEKGELTVHMTKLHKVRREYLATLETFRWWQWPYMSSTTYMVNRISDNNMINAVCSDYDAYMHKYHWFWTFKAYLWTEAGAKNYSYAKYDLNNTRAAGATVTDDQLEQFKEKGVDVEQLVEQGDLQKEDACAEDYKSVIILLRIEEDSVPVFTHDGIVLQLCLLFGKIGGYLSFAGVVFHIFFARKNKDSDIVTTYNELTICGAEKAWIDSAMSVDEESVTNSPCHAQSRQQVLQHCESGNSTASAHRLLA